LSYWCLTPFLPQSRRKRFAKFIQVGALGRETIQPAEFFLVQNLAQCLGEIARDGTKAIFEVVENELVAAFCLPFLQHLAGPA
jgi:hypothetical protein